MSESPEVPDEEPVPVIDSDAKDTSEATIDLQQRLKDTGDALKDASRRFGMMTARFAKKTGDEVKQGRGQDQPIHSIWSRERKREKGKATGRKNRYAPRRRTVPGNGIIETLPDMVDLPTPDEFERENERQEHLAMFEAQTETQLSIIEELQRMSSRLDDLERAEQSACNTYPFRQ